MRSSRYLTVVLLAFVSSVPVARPGAQVPQPYRNTSGNIDASGVANRLRAHGDAGPALYVLRQEHHAQHQRTLDEIADTLTQIALTLPGDAPLAIRTRRSAVRVLRFAGKHYDGGSNAGIGEGKGVPYMGAAGRLLTILETAPSSETRHDALVALPDVLQGSVLLSVLRKVATSPEPLAVTAIVMLNRAGQEGIEVLRELHSLGLVTAAGPNEVLARIAGAYGWPTAEFSPGVVTPSPTRP